MPSVKSRVAFAGGKYLVTHPRGRVTRFVVRLAVRRASTKLLTATHADAIPATRGSRLTTVVGVVAVAGGIVLVVRVTAKSEEVASPVAVPAPHVPSGAAAATPPPTPPTAEAAETAAVGADHADDALVARVQAKLFGGTPPLGLTVESHAGVVTLRGQVSDEDAEVRFVRDAETIEGVKAVQSELQTAGAEPGPPAS